MAYTEEKYIDLDGQELTKITYSDGTTYYYSEQGKLNRLDGPAWIWSDGTEIWYKDGLYHRLDGPACVYSDGSEYWYKDGEEVSRKEIDLIWLKKQVEG